ncbi:MAG: hypothetical protein Q9209_005833 [Squamulea sp. 1 TL-2023]
MPSNKWQDGYDCEVEPLDIHQNESGLPLRNKRQDTARLHRLSPEAIPAHAENLKRRLDDLYRATRGPEAVPQKTAKQFSESFNVLYDKLIPETTGLNLALHIRGIIADMHKKGDLNAATANHKTGITQAHDKCARRIKAFCVELPLPFSARRDVDPELAILVAFCDDGAVAVLRVLTGDKVLNKLRKALHEAYWWFLEAGFVGWVIAARQLPRGDVEVFVDNIKHHNAVQEYTAWQSTFVERLTQESCCYGVSTVGLGVSQLSNLHDEDERTALIQRLFYWNKSRIVRLNRVEDILSVEIRTTIYKSPMVVVNLALPEIANQLIQKGILWNEIEFPCRKHARESSLFQCEECHSFGHTSNSCT